MRGGTPNPNVPWRNWYGLTRWRKRRRHQLYLEPYCRFCHQRGVIQPAEIVDHITHHRGNWNAFWLGELQSLCKDCHDSAKQQIEHKGYDPYWVGDDGWPADPNHPANR